LQFSAEVVAIKPLFLIVLLTIGLRFTGLTFDSLWLDEGYQTVVESYGNELPNLTDSRAEPFLFKPGKPASLPDVLKNFRKVDPLCPPLFALTMNRWLTAFGGSDFSLRALSAIISSIAVLVVFGLGNLLLGPRAAYFAALIQAISPFDIAYAQEARMYTLVIAAAALSAGSFILLSSRRQNCKTLTYAAIYIVSTWAVVNTHYTGLFLWAFEIVAGLALALLRKDWLLLSWLAVANLIVGALCLPWYPLFQQAASIRTESFYVARSPSWWWPFWGALVRIPLNWIIFLAGKRVAIVAAPIYFFASVILAPGFLVIVRGATNCLKATRHSLPEEKISRRRWPAKTVNLIACICSCLPGVFFLLLQFGLSMSLKITG
jgi:4-amino-4-deoxy-L-arabinose transferase-like glycosyltransferase